MTFQFVLIYLKDSLQAFSSSIAGLLASRAVLESVGIGDSNASPTAALLLSVMQDSIGRIATILFAARLGTSLEPECKMYRLLADVFNDAAMILDCLSPSLPPFGRVLVLCAAGVLRSLCGVAAGSSKASLSAHFATEGNLGELNAVSFYICEGCAGADLQIERLQSRDYNLTFRNAHWINGCFIYNNSNSYMDSFDLFTRNSSIH